jgi:hypothetical protein
MDNNLERLRSIKTFPSLVRYLRDELDWPIESDDVEDLSFDYQPEELGLDAKTAVKIKEIKQLRPFVSGQPWGIFFVEFENKKLPVVVLRSILSHLVVKKRASANRAMLSAGSRMIYCSSRPLAMKIPISVKLPLHTFTRKQATCRPFECSAGTVPTRL